jgi:hypothetical protein
MRPAPRNLLRSATTDTKNTKDTKRISFVLFVYFVPFVVGCGIRRCSRQHCDFSLKRWSLPVWVLGSALTNLTERGYL